MKIDFGRLFDNKRFLILFSVVTAFIAWLITVNFIDTQGSYTVKDVPVDFQAVEESDQLALSSLKVVEDQDIKVDVVIEGDRAQVGRIRPADLQVVPDLSGITKPGTYPSVRLTCKSRYVRGFTIQGIHPETISLKVDRYVTKTFSVTPSVQGLKIPEEGYLGAGTTVSPEKIEVYGPESVISQIDKCVAAVQFTEPLTSTKTVRSQLYFYDSEGNEVSKDLLSLDQESADITVQVFEQKELPVRFDYLNVPDGFPLDELEYELTQDTILVAGPASVLNQQQEISLGYVDLKEVTAGFVQVFDVTLPSGLMNINNVQTIGVTFLNSDMLQTTYTVSDIKVINVPVNYEVTVNTPQIAGVNIIGSPEVMETLSSQDIVAEVDLSEREVAPGPYNLPVHILVPGGKLAWAVGDYSVVVTIKEKE